MPKDGISYNSIQIHGFRVTNPLESYRNKSGTVLFDQLGPILFYGINIAVKSYPLG